MIALSLFVLGTSILILSGTSLVIILGKNKSIFLALALGLPMGALINVLLIFVLTVIKIPLTSLSIYGPLTCITALFCFTAYRMRREMKHAPHQPIVQRNLGTTLFVAVCVLIIGSVVIESFAHAVMLPTFQYDSATNWTMRSKISYIDRSIAFDRTEDRGMAKPQYPFLFHALQITANETQVEWNDTVANSILWLLSLSTLTALFLAVKQSRSTMHALLVLTSILSIPLFALHLSQGYGDNVLAQYFLLSLVFLHLALEEQSMDHRTRLLLLSGIFVSVSVWTKSEGTFFGLIPWMVILMGSFGRKGQWKKNVCLPLITAILLSIPWHIFALMKGLLLTPHTSDTLVSFHPEAFTEVIHGLFDRGSFGIAWYAIIILIGVILYESWKKNPRIEKTHFIGILWGCIVFVEFLFVYTATPNVRFLMNAESFYRQMMIPAVMLILSISMSIDKAIRHKQ